MDSESINFTSHSRNISQSTKLSEHAGNNVTNCRHLDMLLWLLFTIDISSCPYSHQNIGGKKQWWKFIAWWRRLWLMILPAGSGLLLSVPGCSLWSGRSWWPRTGQAPTSACAEALTPDGFAPRSAGCSNVNMLDYIFEHPGSVRSPK